MDSNLPSKFKVFISPNLISVLKEIGNENVVLLKQSLEIAFSTVLIGLHNRINEASLYENVLQSIEKTEFYNTFENEKLLTINNSLLIEGSETLNLVFFNKKDRVTEMISNEAGIKSETAATILLLSTLYVFSYFKKNDFAKVPLQELLDDQKDEILKIIPQGIKLILGFSTIDSLEDDSNCIFKSNIFHFFKLNKFF